MAAPIIDDERFIEAVRSFPCLWDNRCKAYKEQRTKDNAWKAIIALLKISNVSPDDLHKRWKALRDRYCREAKKIKSKKSGDQGPPYKPVWPMYSVLSFVELAIKHRPTSSNLAVHVADEVPATCTEDAEDLDSIESEDQRVTFTPVASSSEPASEPASEPPSRPPSRTPSRTSSRSDRKRPADNELETLLMSKLKNDSRVEDEEDLFGRQMACILRRLPPRVKAISKLRIQELLVDAEFPDDESSQAPTRSTEHDSECYDYSQDPSPYNFEEYNN